MKTIRIPGKQTRKMHAVEPADVQLIGAHADYRREDFVFARTQSLEMRDMEWEGRLKPLKSWVPNFAANLAFGIFA